MIAALALTVALYMTAVFFNQIRLSVKVQRLLDKHPDLELKPVKLTAQAILSSLCWGIFYYLA
jgi:hypothetical protein